MNQVKVKKAKLVEIISANRNEHREIFLKAQEGYRKAVIEKLDEALADARSGRAILSVYSFVAPEDHTRDYDRVLKMLDLSVDEEIVIEEQEFQCYVLDEWTWTRNWAASNRSYTRHAKLGNA